MFLTLYQIKFLGDIFVCISFIQMFDTYRNHVPEGTEVDIVVAEFEMLNHCSTSYKVMLFFTNSILVYCDECFAWMVVLG